MVRSDLMATASLAAGRVGGLHPVQPQHQGRSIKFPTDEGYYWRGSPGSRQRPCVFLADSWRERGQHETGSWRRGNEKLSAALRSRVGQAASPKDNMEGVLIRSSNMGQLNRITQQPEVMGGKACIRGMRVTVGMVVGQIGAGRSVDEILTDFPYLERDDITQALRYAAWRADEREVMLATA